MRIKSYFAPSVQEAMEKARVELGPEAMLVSSKKTGPELSRLGAYEVVFGITNEQPAEIRANSRAVSSAAMPGNSGVLVRELADLRKQIETVRRSVSRQRNSGVPEFEELYQRLIAADFSDEIADELVQCVASRTTIPEEEPRRNRDKRPLVIEQLCNTLREELEERLCVSPELGAAGLEQRAVAFVGPSGAGKTTSLVKLALTYGVASRTPLQIFSTDALRVGGSEQLGAYARIMGVGFQAVPAMSALEQALEECRAKKLILIDTPGYGPTEMDEARELKSFLFRNRNIEVQLVIPATLRPTAVASVLGRFAIFHPSKILFTHLDDAEMPGTVLDTALRSGLPISFLAAGQQIPQDIQEASKERLMEKLFDHVAEATVAAA